MLYKVIRRARSRQEVAWLSKPSSSKYHPKLRNRPSSLISTVDKEHVWTNSSRDHPKLIDTRRNRPKKEPKNFRSWAFASRLTFKATWTFYTPHMRALTQQRLARRMYLSLLKQHAVSPAAAIYYYQHTLFFLFLSEFPQPHLTERLIVQ